MKINVQKEKIILFKCIISVVLIIIALCCSMLDYQAYKKGQEVGIKAVEEFIPTMLSAAGSNSKDSHEEKCQNLYSYLSEYYRDIPMPYGGGIIDNSGLRKNHDKIKENLYTIINALGFGRYSAYNIEEWFKHTNFVDYLFKCKNSWGIFILTFCIIISMFVIPTVTKGFYQETDFEQEHIDIQFLTLVEPPFCHKPKCYNSICKTNR